MVSSPGTNEVDIFAGGSLISLSVGAGNTNIPLLKLGDVNSDGISDVGIVADNKIYVYDGSTGVTAVGGPNFTIQTVTGGTVVNGGTIGDFNGDGKDDLGVIFANGTHADIYVVYGGTLSGGATVSENWLNNTHNAFHMTLDGTTASDLNGMYITSAGDMNGDGLGDLAIAMPNLDNGGSPSGDGSVFIVYGQAIGTANFLMSCTPATHSVRSKYFAAESPPSCRLRAL